MSATVVDPVETLPAPTVKQDEFADLYDQYVGDVDLPTTEWLTRLKLQRPRRNTRCLGESTRLLKRTTDVIVASIMLVLLSPAMLLVAIAVRLTSRGPIIFKQTRVGLNLRNPKPDRRHRVSADMPDGIDRRDPNRDRRRDQIGRAHV